MISKEYTAVFALALVMAVRMLGLFMILPVFSMHAGDFAHANAQLIGLALGIYGLTQALLQMPFGLLSDRMGRKPVMIIGLGIFIAGSVCAALSHSIYGLIIGRALQGGGAIGSTVLAMVADVTRDENRSKAMGVMGLAIGGSFAVAMIVGPSLNAWLGLSGIFWMTAGLAVVAELIVWRVIPTPPTWENLQPQHHKAGLTQVLQNRDLLRLDASIFILHAILTAFFIAVPIILTHNFQLTASQQTWLYLLVLILAFALMLPPMIVAEKKRHMKGVFLGAIGLLLGSQLLLWRFYSHFSAVILLLLLFFTAFSLLEAVLPSWVSKVAPRQYKGTAMGCYSSAQFFGIFVGGSGGGWVFAHFGLAGIFGFGSVLAVLWLILAVRLSPPIYGIDGVTEVAMMPEEAGIYMKIDQTVESKPQLHQSLEKSKLVGTHTPQGGMPVGEG